MGIEPTVQIQSVFELPIGNTGVSYNIKEFVNETIEKYLQSK